MTNFWENLLHVLVRKCSSLPLEDRLCLYHTTMSSIHSVASWLQALDL